MFRTFPKSKIYYSAHACPSMKASDVSTADLMRFLRGWSGALINSTSPSTRIGLSPYRLGLIRSAAQLQAQIKHLDDFHMLFNFQPHSLRSKRVNLHLNGPSATPTGAWFHDRLRRGTVENQLKQLKPLERVREITDESTKNVGSRAPLDHLNH